MLHIFVIFIQYNQIRVKRFSTESHFTRIFIIVVWEGEVKGVKFTSFCGAILKERRESTIHKQLSHEFFPPTHTNKSQQQQSDSCNSYFVKMQKRENCSKFYWEREKEAFACAQWWIFISFQKLFSCFIVWVMRTKIFLYGY